MYYAIDDLPRAKAVVLKGLEDAQKKTNNLKALLTLIEEEEEAFRAT